ncbi:methylated-DNA--[protein]-cysteine S-methyltransferase [Cetobacterium sp. 8H]|uniref:methylated-DNA--[protein]-cysteine S-methyltransferase n=1 Tax=Cetobacterium sp. 8H TaxID=2759681 RepID=UPI00163CAF03|nr:methylated-DNA--[protein]-cysteine S-methyltransferase [Cetobacterium sp. 8H]MBC2850713.1 methylated-DNA--[protein]-cysteine S-methyltransferase [Cetobacterium sp. 8H]
MGNYFYVFETRFGLLKIESNDEYVTAIEFNNPISNNQYQLNDTIKSAFLELNEFFEGKRKSFSFPIKLNGTEFQKSVWNELMKIPYGETRTYKEIAISIGNPKACRAVGLANNKNPLPIVVPCHRVIGSKGALTGYAYGLNMKETLLKLEKGMK